MKSSIIGFLLGILVIGASLFITSDNAIIYLNILAFVIVLGGTVSVAIITYGIRDVLSVAKIFLNIFKRDHHSETKVTSDLIRVSKRIFKNKNELSSIIKNESENHHPFIIDGLKMIENQLNSEQIEEVLHTTIRERGQHFNLEIEMLQVIAKYPPAFGMIGTIIGLVAVLQKLDNFKSVSALGPNMAVALITTLYGLFLANYFFNPVADHLASASKHDLRIRRIIMEGITLIKADEDPVYVAERLKGYLIPSERKIVENEFAVVEQAQEAA